MVNEKDPIPKFLKSFVVYKFVCPGCNACYIGETTSHLSTKIREHLETDKKSHIFAHLVNNETCKALSTENCFEIIDSASTPFKGYLRYKTITSQNVPSKAQLKNYFISQKNYVPFSRYSSFFIFNHSMIYQISDVTMSIST